MFEYTDSFAACTVTKASVKHVITHYYTLFMGLGLKRSYLCPLVPVFGVVLVY